MVDTNAHPATIVANIINAIGRSASQLRDREIMDAHHFGRASRSIFAPAILKVSNQLFLLGIDRDCWCGRNQRLPHVFIDVMELLIAIRMIGAFAGFAIGLQAISLIYAAGWRRHYGQSDSRDHATRPPNCAGCGPSITAALQDRRG